MAEISQMPVSQFPHEEEITLTLKIRTSTFEDRAYFIGENGELQLGFIADCWDMFEMIEGHILMINGKTQSQIQKELQSGAEEAI